MQNKKTCNEERWKAEEFYVCFMLKRRKLKKFILHRTWKLFLTREFLALEILKWFWRRVRKITEKHSLAKVYAWEWKLVFVFMLENKVKDASLNSLENIH